LKNFDGLHHNPAMADSTSQRLVLLTATLGLWLLVAASATYWILQINGQPSSSNLPAATAFKADPLDTTSLARLLGATPTQTAAPVSNSSRFALKGVVSGALGKEAALIAIDNKPPLTFKVGSVVEEGLILQSATAGKVTLSASRDGPALMTLEMPSLDK
jgi:general secretion pathway protein C